MKKTFIILLSALIAFSCLSGCDRAGSFTENFFAMDTVMSITAYGDGAEDALQAAKAEINRLDALLSTGNDDSEISTINSTGMGSLSGDTAYLVSRSIDIYGDTGGAFDITIYPVMQAWGFPEKDYSVPSDEALASLAPLIGSDKINYDGSTGVLSFAVGGMKIDLGGIAKGYSSQQVSDILRSYGIDSAIITLGGNVQALGVKPDGSEWSVAVQDPFGSDGSYYGIVSVSDKAVITSGGYQRYFEEDGVRYHHIIDPSTLKPADSGLSSVTIVTDDPTLGDALSTALFVMGLDDAVSYWQARSDLFDFIIIDDAGNTYISSGISRSFTSDHAFSIIY